MSFHMQLWCWISPSNKFLKIKPKHLFWLQNHKVHSYRSSLLHFQLCQHSLAIFFSRDWLQVWNTCCAGPNTCKSGWDPRRKKKKKKKVRLNSRNCSSSPVYFFFFLLFPEVLLLSFHRNHCKDITLCMARKLLLTATVISLSSFHSTTVSLLLSNPFESMQAVGSGGSPWSFWFVRFNPVWSFKCNTSHNAFQVLLYFNSNWDTSHDIILVLCQGLPKTSFNLTI